MNMSTDLLYSSPAPAYAGDALAAGDFEPAEFALVGAARGSARRFDQVMVMASMDPHNRLLTTDPLPALNQGFAKGFRVAAVVTLVGTTAGVADWGVQQAIPSTVVAWDDAVQRQRTHPTMNSPEVLSYVQAAPSVDIHALRGLYDRFMAAFSDADQLEASYRFSADRETETPRLFLLIDTHGMDLHEVMRREMALHSEIEQDPALKAITANHIISVV